MTMSLQEFKDTLSNSWHDSLEEVGGDYRQDVSEMILGAKSKESTEWMAEHVSEHLGKVIELEKKHGVEQGTYTKPVFENVRKLSDIGTSLIYDSAKIIELAGLKNYQTIVDVSHKLHEKRKFAAFMLLDRSVKILELEGMEGYRAVVKGLMEILRKESKAKHKYIWDYMRKDSTTTGLVMSSDKIVQAGGIKGYKAVIEGMLKLMDKESILGEALCSSSAKILEYGGIKLLNTVVEDTLEVAGMKRGGFYLAQNAGKILKISGKRGYKLVSNTLKKLKVAGHELAENSAELLEISGFNRYKKVVKSIKKFEDKFESIDDEISKHDYESSMEKLAKDSVQIIKAGGVKGYKAVVSSMQKFYKMGETINEKDEMKQRRKKSNQKDIIEHLISDSDKIFEIGGVKLYKSVVDGISRVAETSWELADTVSLYAGAKIVKYTGIKGYNVLIDTILKVREKDKHLCWELARGAKSIFKRVKELEEKDGIEQEAYAEKVFKTIAEVTKDHKWIAKALIKESKKLLDVGGMGTYDTIINYTLKLVKKDKWTAYDLMNNSVEIVQGISTVNEGLLPHVIDAVEKVMNEDIDIGYKIFKNSPKVLEKIYVSGEFDTDVFLIESIEDQADAQVISQLIDMKRYQDLYNEKVARFY